MQAEPPAMPPFVCTQATVGSRLAPLTRALGGLLNCQAAANIESWVRASLGCCQAWAPC